MHSRGPLLKSFLGELHLNTGQWMDYIINNGQRLNPRDETTNKGTSATRITAGYTNNTPHKKTIDIANVKDKEIQMPYLYYETTNKTPKILKQQLGYIISFARETLQEYYPNSFNDKLRSELFGKPLCKAIDNIFIADSEFLICFYQMEQH